LAVIGAGFNRYNIHATLELLASRQLAAPMPGRKRQKPAPRAHRANGYNAPAVQSRVLLE